MHDIPRKTLFHFFHAHLQDLHSLPVYIRKILMVVSMIFASTFVGVFSWLLFSPLQNLSLPSFDGSQQTANYNQAMENLNKAARENELADVSKIIEISPTSGFMESFKAVKDLIVPKNVTANPLKQISESASGRTPSSWFPLWPQKLSGASAVIASKLRELFTFLFEGFQKLQEYVRETAALLLSYAASAASFIMSFLAHIISRISYIMSYASEIPSRALYLLSFASQVPSYVSHIFDVLIASLSRTAI